MQLAAVGKRYGLRQPWTVRDVSLDVPPGRLTCPRRGRPQPRR